MKIDNYMYDDAILYIIEVAVQLMVLWLEKSSSKTFESSVQLSSLSTGISAIFCSKNMYYVHVITRINYTMLAWVYCASLKISTSHDIIWCTVPEKRWS